MKILRSGDAYKYYQECSNCGCVFLFTRHEPDSYFERISYEESKTHYRIRCPECKKNIELGETLNKYLLSDMCECPTFEEILQTR